MTPNKILQKAGGKSLHLVPVKTILKLQNKKLLTRWSENQIENQLVDGIIYLAFINSEGLVCYDGNHRRLALAEEIEDVKILVSVFWSITQINLEKEFDRLNMAVSVPRIMIDRKAQQKKIILYQISLAKFAKTYPGCSKASTTCKRPNFNRDQFLDDLNEIIEDQRFNNLTPEDLVKFIKKTNDCYDMERFGFNKEELSESVKEKCEDSGLWLFCQGRKIDRTYFRKVVKYYQ